MAGCFTKQMPKSQRLTQRGTCFLFTWKFSGVIKVLTTLHLLTLPSHRALASSQGPRHPPKEVRREHRLITRGLCGAGLEGACIMAATFHWLELSHVVMLAARKAEKCGHVSWKR